MIDLSSPDVWPSTREKAASWEKQSYVKKGLLTLWDAANLLDPNGYGGIYETCSTATQGAIDGLYVTLEQSLQKNPPCFFGYPPDKASPLKVKTGFGVEELALYPGVAFLEWYEQHQQEGIDGRYFERYREALSPGEAVYRLFNDAQKKKNPFWGDKEPERNTPYCWRLSRKKELTVDDFACFYCGAGPCVSSSDNLKEELVEHILAWDGERFIDHGLGRYQGYLCGYESANESYFSGELEFPVEAYVAFLKEVGLDVPKEWAHIEPQTIEEPSPIRNEEPAAVEAVAAKDAACESASEEDGRTAGEDVEILDGLTLADFKRYLESNPPLKHVLPIVVRTVLLAEGNREKTNKALTAKLRESARRKGWGTGSGGVLSDAQGEAIDKMFLPVGKAGAGNKKGLRVLPTKEYEKEN